MIQTIRKNIITFFQMLKNAQMEAIAVRQTQSVWTYRVHSSVTANRATQEVALTAQVGNFSIW